MINLSYPIIQCLKNHILKLNTCLLGKSKLEVDLINILRRSPQAVHDYARKKKAHYSHLRESYSLFPGQLSTIENLQVLNVFVLLCMLMTQGCATQNICRCALRTLSNSCFKSKLTNIYFSVSLIRMLTTVLPRLNRTPLRSLRFFVDARFKKSCARKKRLKKNKQQQQ